jgi:WD40 repeat protein
MFRRWRRPHHAADGFVVERATPLAEALPRPWIARDPRPALPSLPACVMIIRDAGISVNVAADASVAISSDSRGLHLWDLSAGALLREFQPSAWPIDSMPLSAESGMALCVERASDKESVLRIWNPGSGVSSRKLEGSIPGKIILSGDGLTAITISKNQGMDIWDVTTGSHRKSFPCEAREVTITADGKLATAINGDNTISTWDISSETRLKTLGTGSDVASHVRASADGRIVVVSYKNCFRVWDAASETCLREVGVCSERSRIECLALTADGRMAFTVAGKFRLFSGERTWDIPNTLQIWDVALGECVRTLTTGVDRIAVTPDGRTVVVSVNGDLTVWNVISEDQLEEGNRDEVSATDVILAPDYQSMMIPCYNDLRLEETGTEVSKTLQGHTDNISSAAWSPDGQLVVSGAFDYHARVWDVSSGMCLRVLDEGDHVNAVAFNADGRLALTAGRRLGVWDLVSGECIKSLGSFAEEGKITTVTLSPDEKFLISANSNCEVCVWNLVKEESEAKSGESDWDYVESAAQNCIFTLRGHDGMILSIALTPDGRKAVTTSIDCTLRVWDLISGQCLHTLTGHTALIRRVALTTDGQAAISASEDGTLCVWDLITGSCPCIYPVRDRKVISVSTIRPDGQFACVTTGGNIHRATLRGMEQTPPIVTATRLFEFSRADSPLCDRVEIELPLFSTGQTMPGRYQDHISVRCPWCGRRTRPSPGAIDAIGGIMKNASLSLDESPCLKLPSEACAEPRLLSQCLYCHQQLRYNPFIVDNQERHQR